ncbi:MAG: heavy metal translocating P-type ATPase, partial [Proteobacteria bacterium]|nr:heavy metal translocating P-type ATPase [Pseudomonadota bacterium]
MERYRVTGMSCAACQAHVEKAVRAVPGVTSCAVSLLTNSMQVEGTAPAGDIVKAVKDAGYGAAPQGGAAAESAAPEEDALQDRETPELLRRLLWSLAVLLPLMYLSLGHMRWGFPIPLFLENGVCMGIMQLILSSVVLFMNRKFFTGGFGAFLHRSTNMDTLVALGSSASFLYSLTALFAMASEMGKGNGAAVESLLMNHLWFETAAMIPCLITFGKTLESYSKGRTTDSLKSLMKLAPKTAVVEKDGKETEIPVSELKPGDIFIVKPGQNIPADGVIVSGTAAIDESALTGESVPSDRKEGDEVAAATVNKSGFIRCRTLRAGEDTSFAAIVRLVSDAAATKAPISRIADRVSAVFVPGVIIVSLITLTGWLITGSDFAFALARAVSVLVISCPCALGLATPVAIMVGNGVGARNG